jgi:hypothetical protein
LLSIADRGKKPLVESIITGTIANELIAVEEK